MSAAQKNSLEVVQLLLENGAQVDKLEQKGGTALFAASQMDNLAIARLLIDKGAQVNHSDSDGNTAIMHAAKANSLGVTKLLIDHGARFDDGNAAGSTPLIRCAVSNSIEVANLLLEKGVEVDKQDARQGTALMFAARHNSLDLVRILLEAGAQMQMKNSLRKTALGIALDNKNSLVVSLLRSHQKNKKTADVAKRSEDVKGYKGDKDIADLLKFLGEDTKTKRVKKPENKNKIEEKKIKPKKKQLKYCFNCHKESNDHSIRKCICKHARYCSQECHEADWAHHRPICLSIRNGGDEGKVIEEIDDVD